MPANQPAFYPVGEPYASVASLVLSKLYFYARRDCNPRIPYILLAWMLIGTDNPFRVVDHLSEVTLTRWVAFQLLTIACGLQAERSEIGHVITATEELARKPNLDKVTWGLQRGLSDARKIVIAASEIASGITRFGFGAHANIAKVRFEYLAFSTKRASQRSDILTVIKERVDVWSALADTELLTVAMGLIQDLLLQPCMPQTAGTA